MNTDPNFPRDPTDPHSPFIGDWQWANVNPAVTVIDAKWERAVYQIPLASPAPGRLFTHVYTSYND